MQDRYQGSHLTESVHCAPILSSRHDNEEGADIRQNDRNPLRVLFVLGTQPEAIKLAPVIHRMKRHDAFQVTVCVTAQHREMLDEVLTLFQIMPDFDLNLMQKNQNLNGLTGQIFHHLDPVLHKVGPHWLLVQGDTTTAMASGIAAYYDQIKVGHVEAGLRTHDKFQPFPEEVNRRIVSVLGDCHFAPTANASRNLLNEGIDPKSVFITGNTVIDSLMDVANSDCDITTGPLGAIPENRRLILVTAHRRENFGAPLRSICDALIDLVQMYKDDVHVVYPVHLNPNVKEPVCGMLGDVPGISLVQPLDYRTLVHLMKRAHLILTDSGGIQEEAPSLGKPVLVLREKTERPEGVEAGTAKLVGTRRELIAQEVAALLDSPSAYKKMAKAVNPYGDGQASDRICDILLSYPL